MKVSTQEILESNLFKTQDEVRALRKQNVNLKMIYADAINTMIQTLREIDLEILDSNEFDWAIESVRYSQAQDKIIFETKEAEGDIDYDAI